MAKNQCFLFIRSLSCGDAEIGETNFRRIVVRSMTRHRVAIIFLAALLSGCTSTAHARFGLINGIDIVQTRHIPYSIGAHYGFRVDYHDTGKPVTLCEEFRSPAPVHWRSSSPSSQRMSRTPDGRTMTREVQLGSHTPAPPGIHSLYVEDIQIARGDPKGQYIVRLRLDGKPFKKFEYTVE